MSESKNGLSSNNASPILDYASPPGPTRGRWKQRLTICSVLALACIGAVLVILPALGRTTCGCGRTTSGANLHQLIEAIVFYANNHQGALPSGWEDLEKENYMSPASLRKVLIDPTTSDRPLPAGVGIDSLYRRGRPEQYLTRKTHPSLNVSYIYAGKGLNLHTAARETIVIYEPLSSSTPGGEPWINVAYIDGSVKTFSSPAAEKLIVELQADQNPPPTLKKIEGLP